MPSIVSLRGCAEIHLDHYTDWKGSRAFRTYDRLGDPALLTPLDCLAPALLSVRIDYRQVVPLFAPSGPGAVVLAAMQAVLDHPRSSTDHFLDLDLGDHTSSWATVDAALVASGEAEGRGIPGLKAVAVTKILHRKRPHLVPILDSRVYRFYMGRKLTTGAYKDTPREFWPVLQADLRENRDWLTELARSKRTPDDRPVSVLRTADIIVWEHEVECTLADSTSLDPLV